MISSGDSEFLAEHLRVFGVDPVIVRDQVILLPQSSSAVRMRGLQHAPGSVVIMEQPSAEVLADIGLRIVGTSDDGSLWFNQTKPGQPRLRTLGPVFRYLGDQWRSVVVDDSGYGVWVTRSFESHSLIVLGTTLIADLLLMRQGDPAAVPDDQSSMMWGFSSERPNYLFRKTAPESGSMERQADYWAELLASEVAAATGSTRRPILPLGAPGALVITGDDDQAEVDRYREQLAALHGLPITYFLHPKTHLTRSLLREFRRSHGRIEFGIHPDALDAPSEYRRLFVEQSAWFRRLTGSGPKFVRNHGYLNDGYWGHLPAWLDQGVTLSSNIPGVDGQVVTNSLIPMRIVVEGRLTEHWSIVTLFGDGMVSALGMTAEDAGQRIVTASEMIRQSGIPGIIVVNVHPQNFPDNIPLHDALRTVAESDFLCWTVSEMMEWFQSRDERRTSRVRLPRRFRTQRDRWRSK